MSEYQLTHTGHILRLADNAWIPPDPANRDYQAFREWVKAGGTPLPAPVPAPQVQLPQPTTLEADAEHDMDAVTLRQLNDALAQAVQPVRRG